jgi:rSAM/selenodomain-associated transferase 2
MISVIVPIKDEDPAIAENFRGFVRPEECELLIAGGARNSQAARAFVAIGARVLGSEGTRGARLAHAAGQARGDVLFFLHADSRPPEGALALIREALGTGASAGAFSLAYEDPTPALRWIAWWANVRSRVFRLPFGDQGLFCRRTFYDRSGGFRDLPICDDLDLVRRWKRLGRLVVLRERAVTSARRYRAGAFSRVLRNWRVLAGYYAGVSPEKLERWYRGG